MFFNLRKAQSKISILDDGDMRLDQVKIIARRIGVTETDVIYMNRRLGGDASLNAAIREDGDSGEWQDWLVDESPDQETTLAASEEFDNRRKTLSDALTVLNERSGPRRSCVGIGPASVATGVGNDLMVFRTDGNHRYSRTNNKRFPFVSWTRPRTFRRNTIS